jgi:hypothetical protein
MPKTLLVSTDLDNKFYTALEAGNYTYPQQVTIDSYGRIATITTSSGYRQPATLGSINGTAGSITVSTSTGSVIADLVSISTAGSYLYPTQLSIDSYGRFTAITTATPSYISTTYNSIINLTINAYGKISSVTTGTSVSIQYRPTRQYIVDATINGLTTNIPIDLFTFMPYLGSTWTYIADVSTASVFCKTSGETSISWAFAFTGVPALINRSVSVTATVGTTFNGTGTTTNTNTISINGVNSAIKWLDGRPPYSYTGTTVVNYNIFYDGAAYTVYANEAAYW